MAKPTPNDLTKEKSLFALWKLSFKFGQSRFNLIVALLVSGMILRLVWLVPEHPELITGQLRRLVTTGIAFAPSTLGFLIAGFTVFVTVIRIDVFLAMAQREKPNTGESFLKYNLSAFMVVFVHYVSYLFSCIMLDLFIQPGGLASIALANARTYPEIASQVDTAKYWVNGGLLVLMGGWTVYLVMLLKSLIFNVYHVTLTAVRWEWEKPPPSWRD
jgi:hypothetical protein